MKVDINHREETSGWLRKTTLYVVDLTVTFSEEELQLIRQHRMEKLILLERGVPAGRNPNKFVGIEDVFNLTVERLMKKGTDSYALETPFEAKEYEVELHEILPKFKAYLNENAGIEEKSTSFEL